MSSSKRTTTVTHPDGTVSTRKSESRTYTHAVEVGPAPAEAMAAYLDRQAAKMEAAATALREAANSARVTIQDRRLGGNARDLVTHVAKLAGTDVYTWCSADGRTNSYREGADGAVVDVAPYLRNCARDNAAAREEGAAKNRSEAAAIRAAGEPVGGWSVVRWSSRADLAHAALSTFNHLAAQGRPVRVVAVDATPAPVKPARPAPMDSLAAFRRAAVAGSRWQCVNHFLPHVSGLRVVRGGTRVLSYDAITASGAEIGNGRLELPNADAVRFDGDSVHFLQADGRVRFTWIREGCEPARVDQEYTPREVWGMISAACQRGQDYDTCPRRQRMEAAQRDAHTLPDATRSDLVGAAIADTRDVLARHAAYLAAYAARLDGSADEVDRRALPYAAGTSPRPFVSGWATLNDD